MAGGMHAPHAPKPKAQTPWQRTLYMSPSRETTEQEEEEMGYPPRSHPDPHRHTAELEVT